MEHVGRTADGHQDDIDPSQETEAADAGRAENERWTAYLTALIGRQLSRLRELRGLTAKQLSSECGRLGQPIARSTIAKIEAAGGMLEKSEITGEPFDPSRVARRFVTAAELLVLAHALQVPATLLIAPVDRVSTVEVLPGETLPAWEALERLTGERDMRDSASADLPRMMLSEYREYVRLLRQYRTLLTDASADSDDLKHRLEATRSLIAKRRHQLEKFYEVENPSVPGDLAYLL